MKITNDTHIELIGFYSNDNGIIYKLETDYESNEL